MVTLSACVVSDRAARRALASADRSLTPSMASDTSDTTRSSWRRRSRSVTGIRSVMLRTASASARQSASRPEGSAASASAFSSLWSAVHFSASARSWAACAATREVPERAESSRREARLLSRVLRAPSWAAAERSCCWASGSWAASRLCSKRSSARSTPASAV